MNTYYRLLNIIAEKGAAYLILIDPDKYEQNKLSSFIQFCNQSGVDGFLVGGSILLSDNFNKCIDTIRQNTPLPLIIFPGNINQINPSADAILFLSVISGRNPEDLIGKHVAAAPIIKNAAIEPIPTGYILIDSGSITAAQYFSGSIPVPSNKPEIAAATALAGEYLGMKFIYLEAGSGADRPVSPEVVNAVSSYCSIPVITGGGIKDPVLARELVKNGAGIIVTGNYFEHEENWYMVKLFAEAVHINQLIEV
jgi:phosphoglycerol geranylgeranyltransferase